MVGSLEPKNAQGEDNLIDYLSSWGESGSPPGRRPAPQGTARNSCGQSCWNGLVEPIGWSEYPSVIEYCQLFQIEFI